MMFVAISNKKNKVINIIFDWLLYMIGYTFVLITVSVIFKNTVYIDGSYFGLYCFLATVLIYILNKTIKPFLFWLTLPITGITLGLFYPFLNLFILKIVDFIMGGYFDIHGFFMS